ncbi:MAG: glycosyltransferase family 4 protein [Caldilineaceae bacterium]
MKILFLSQVFPFPLDAGPKVRSYYVLRYLAQKHDVTLVSFVRSTDTEQATQHVRQFCPAIYTTLMERSSLKDLNFLLKSLPSRTPFLISRDWSQEMVAQIEQAVREQGPFDFVHADQLWMAPYALHVMRQQGARNAVLDQHNATFMIAQRMAQAERNPLKQLIFRLEARKLATYEVDVCRQFEHVTWVIPEDHAAVQAHAKSRSFSVPNSGVIPICIDAESEPIIKRSATGKRVTFLGGLHYPPNAQGINWYAQHAFPKVLQQIPDAVLTVIGKQPPPELHTFGIPERNLHVTGYIDDPRPLLAETQVFVVPLLAGGGMRVKIIDGWRWGLPILSTTIGAEGIRRHDGEHLLIADTPTVLADETVRLFCDTKLNEELAQAGRNWVEESYHWRNVYRAWDTIYTEALP